MSKMSKLPRIEYIQFLRAICVLLVLLFHIDESWMPSGYLGVDAFFAISGFVVTRMIYPELVSGTFSLKNFYASRVKKLLPPMLVVVVVTCLVFLIIFEGEDLVTLYQAAAAALISVANIYFYFDAGYFSEASIFKPLLHMWSLGVEEQYYLLWPLCLLFIFRSRLSILFLLVIFGVLTLGVSAYAARSEFDAVFYLTPFRVYQLLFGAIGAVYCLKSNMDDRLASLRFLIWVVPIVLCGIAILPTSNPESQFYTQAGVSILIAVSCVISHNLKMSQIDRVSVRDDTSVVERVYKLRLFQYLGDISYQLYLVHWPLIVAVTVVYSSVYHNSIAIKLSILFISVALAEILKRSVLRIFNTITPKLIIILIGFLSIVLFSLSYSFEHASMRYGASEGKNSVNKKVSMRKALELALRDDDCNIGLSSSSPEDSFLRLDACLNRGGGQVLVLGDSYSRGVYLGLKSALPERRVVRLYVPGCPPYFDAEFKRRNAFRGIKKCAEFDEFPWSIVFKSLISEGVNASLVLAGNWTAKAHSQASLEDTFRNFASINDSTYIIGVRPVFKQSVVRLFWGDQISLNPRSSMHDYLYSPKHLPSVKVLNEGLSKWFEGLFARPYVNVLQDLCGLTCPASFKGELMYYDTAHLSMAGVEYLSKQPEFEALVNELKKGLDLTINY